MGFSEAIRTCFRKYATFSGRASRSEYWYFILFLVLTSFVLNILDAAIFGGQVTTTTAPGAVGVEMQSNGPLATLFSLATFVPALAAGWRRMHDTGRSGLFLLYPLIVFAGLVMFIGFMSGFDTVLAGDVGAVFAGVGAVVAVLVMLVLMISPLMVLWWLTRPGQPDRNEYGPPPRMG